MEKIVQEMTLQEWCDTLPIDHLAGKQLASLQSEVCKLREAILKKVLITFENKEQYIQDLGDKLCNVRIGLAESLAQNDSLQSELSAKAKELIRLETIRRRQAKELLALRAELEKYGKHLKDCDLVRQPLLSAANSYWSCTCGLAQALQAKGGG